MGDDPLIIVSNRGPAQFERAEDGERTVRRGGGGLVTALSGLVSHREALWIASAMTDEDVAVSEERGGPVELSIDGIELPGAAGRQRRRRIRPLLQRDRQPDPLVHPALPLGPLQRARHPSRGARRLGQRLPGGQPRHRDRRARPDRGPRAAAGDAPRLPPLHGAGDDPGRAPRRLPAPLRPHPLVAARQLARAPRPDPRGALPRHARQRHHRLPHPHLLHQLPPLLRRTARGRGRLRAAAGAPRGRRDAGARLPALDRRRAAAAGGRDAGGGAATSARCWSAGAST